ncbi:AEC family transporter [Acidaminococcus timonensis]|jgi:predicted permease|uniref:AEC family transporter n=1 Tax=Acidaminococcus timonensis TaxID=1871002 RepID=UPI0025F8068B|nr:AEC family transporter [Acidaminococcus timonensis]MDD6569669.1 AEC family transporter [Acidaminococcus sp.]
MDIVRLGNLQLSLFLMILIGLVLRKKNIIDEPGKRCLTDVVVNIIIPCNIIKSCLMPFEGNIFVTCSRILAAGAILQLIFMGLNHFLFNRYPDTRKKVLQYGTLVSNSGFLGYPVAEGVYGSLGLFYASVFLIPLRMVMWSVGTSYFMASHMSRRQVLQKVLTHPCLIGVYIGILIMVTQVHLPGFLTMTIKYIGSCNAAITMFIIGTILADVPFLTIFNRDSFLYSVLRLLLLPALAWGVSAALHLDAVATGIAVLMTGMPAGATTAIFAARYGSDAPFATKLTVLSTVLSMFTILFWCAVLPEP